MPNQPNPEDLRKLADLIESGTLPDVQIIAVCYVYPQTRQEAVDLLRAWNAFPHCDLPHEVPVDNVVQIGTVIGDGLEMYGSVSRDGVCKRIKTGTRTVQVPDPDAPKVDKIEDVYEWECPDMLAEAKGQSGDAGS